MFSVTDGSAWPAQAEATCNVAVTQAMESHMWHANALGLASKLLGESLLLPS